MLQACKATFENVNDLNIVSGREHDGGSSVVGYKGDPALGLFSYYAPSSYRDSVPSYFQDTATCSYRVPVPVSYKDPGLNAGNNNVTVQSTLNEFYQGLVSGDIQYLEFQDSIADLQ